MSECNMKIRVCTRDTKEMQDTAHASYNILIKYLLISNGTNHGGDVENNNNSVVVVASFCRNFDIKIL